MNTGTFSPETFSDLGEDHHGATEMHQNFRLDLQITRWKRSGAERGWWTTQTCGNLAMRHLTHQVLLIHRFIWFSFCVPISRVMPRRGWRTVEGPMDQSRAQSSGPRSTALVSRIRANVHFEIRTTPLYCVCCIEGSSPSSDVSNPGSPCAERRRP